MKRQSKKKGHKKSRKKSSAGKTLFFLVVIGVGLLLAYQFRKEILKALEPLLQKTPEKKLERRAEKEPKRKTGGQEKKAVTLYFSGEEGEYLTGERREILNKESDQEEAGEVIEELIKGPKGRLIRTLPPRTKLLDVQIDERGVARVNFDRTLSRDHPGGSSAEIMTVYSVVNSLTFNFPKIKKVQILIEGKGESITGHLVLDRPISSRADLIKK